MNTKFKTEPYLAPESVAIDIEPEAVLCTSPESGGTIDDFDVISGDWN